MELISNVLLACSTSAEPASHGILTAGRVTAGFLLAVLAAMIIIRRLRRFGVFFAYGVVIALLAVLWPAVEAAREAARRSSCNCNVSQIGLALQTYADVYKSFPPSYVTDAKGNRMHSWRVLILPYMEQKPLYNQNRLNEPWDSPHNRSLAKYMPPVYRCPSDDVSQPGETSYATIEGPGTGMSSNRGSTFSDFKDGTSNTIAVVEAVGSGINWMEPRDVPFSSLRGGLMSSAKPGIASRHDGACIVGFFDGHHNALQTSIPPKTLQALATRAGGEPINDDF